ncbi:Uncharacterised protein [Vibrio cholerae]|nr:Uncharacterised protein [Vibrio cholerae]
MYCTFPSGANRSSEVEVPDCCKSVVIALSSLVFICDLSRT